MDPPGQFCHNPACADRGQSGRGNLRIHSRKEQQYQCRTCGRSFAATKETPFYRLRRETAVASAGETMF
jgi:transposase-like protein